MNDNSLKHTTDAFDENHIAAVLKLSKLDSYAEFTDLCDEAKRRLMQQALENNKYSFHLAARETGYSNGGMYGLFKTLFSAHDTASKADIISDYFEDYTPQTYSEDQENILNILAAAQTRQQLETIITSAERALFKSTLESCDYNNTTAAELLGVGRKMIARKRQTHGITQPEAPKASPPPKLSNKQLTKLSDELHIQCSYNELNATYNEVRRHHLANALRESGFNIGQAAKSLGYGRSTLKENFERRFNIPKFDIEAADMAIQQWQESKQEQSPALELFLKHAPTPQTAQALYKATHKLIITQTFNANDANQTKTAQNLGLDRMTLKHHLKRYGLLDATSPATASPHLPAEKVEKPPASEDVHKQDSMPETRIAPIQAPEHKEKPDVTENSVIEKTLPSSAITSPSENQGPDEQTQIVVSQSSETKQYNMTEVARAFSEHMSFSTVSKLQYDMTRSLLKRALEKTECNFKEAAEAIELHDKMFANGCRNYLQGVEDGNPSSLSKNSKPLAPDHQSVIHDILPALETYKDLTELFDAAKKLIIEKTLGEQRQNMAKTSRALSLPESMLEKMMQRLDIPKPGIIEPE